MSNAFLYPIRLTIRLSPWLLMAFYGVHAGSLLITLTLPLSWITRLVLLAAILFSAYSIDLKYRRRSDDRSPAELLLNKYDEWSLLMSDDTTRPATLLPLSFVHPYLVVLRFRVGQHKTAVLLTPDSVDTDQLRRLRVRIKFRQSITD